VYDAPRVAERPHKVTVTVEPEGIGATIRVGGEVLKGDSITLVDSYGYASVSVTAPGYFPFRKLVELHADTVVKAKLVPLPSKRKKAMPWVLMAMVIFALVKMVLSC
jgi:hypothetical protein